MKYNRRGKVTETMGKIIMSFLLLCLGIFMPSVVMAEETDESVQYSYSEGVLTVSGKGTANKQEQLDGKPWSYYRENTKKLILQDGITAVGEEAFTKFVNLVEIQFPSKMKVIGNYAFKECSGIKELEIPKGVYRFGYSCFSDCSSLEKVSIGIAYAKTSISPFDVGVFLRDNSLREISVAEGHGFLLAENNVLFNGNKTEMYVYPNLLEGDTYQIPDGVRRINYAFRNNKNLKKIIMPDTITDINSSELYGLESLETLICSNNLKKIAGIGSCPALSNIYLPYNLELIDIGAFSGCSGLKELVVPPRCKLDSGSAYGTGIETIVLPAAMDKMDEKYLLRFTKLKKVYVMNPAMKWNESANILENDDVVFYGYENSTTVAFADKKLYSFQTIDQFPVYYAMSNNVIDKLDITVDRKSFVNGECALGKNICIKKKNPDEAVEVSVNGEIISVGADGYSCELTQPTTVQTYYKKKDVYEWSDLISEANGGEGVFFELKQNISIEDDELYYFYFKGYLNGNGYCITGIEDESNKKSFCYENQGWICNVVFDYEVCDYNEGIISKCKFSLQIKSQG